MSRVPIPLLPAWARWGGVLVVGGVIFYFSVVTVAPAPPKPGSLWDKNLHFVAYAGLTLTLIYATASSSSSGSTRLALVLVTAIGYGIGIELLQAPLANRYFALTDLLANIVGVALATTWFGIEKFLEYSPVSDSDL